MTVLVFDVYVSVGNSEHKNLRELKTVIISALQKLYSVQQLLSCHDFPFSVWKGTVSFIYVLKHMDCFPFTGWFLCTYNQFSFCRSVSSICLLFQLGYNELPF